MHDKRSEISKRVLFWSPNPIFISITSKGKILFGFTVIIIIFSAGLILAYSSSLDISRTNKEILDRYSVVQADTIELS